MTLTNLDDRPALIVIDLQTGIVGLETVHPAQDVVRRSAHLAAAFRSHDLPVVIVDVTGRPSGRTDADQAAGQPSDDAADRAVATKSSSLPVDYGNLVEDLGVQPSDVLVTKQAWGAFHGTPLHERLGELGVTQVVITGIATSMGVESTARSAHEHGYNVVLATDAMTDRNAGAHANSIEWVFPRLGETASTGDILAALDAR
jgi:nicotinamidase-related amidase